MRANEFLAEQDIKNTFNFIKKAHTGQQYGSQPYWTHPRKVAAIGKKLFGAKFNNEAVKVAFLHDVVEDTRYTIEQLAKMGYSAEVIEAVGLLTKNKALSYKDNIKNIIDSGNKLAVMVKYADNYANFTGDKSTWAPEKKASSQKKYKSSMDMIANKTKVDKHTELDTEPEVAENMDHSKDGRAVSELKSALLARKEKLQTATDDQVYDIIDKIMTRIAKSHGISGQDLHDMWVDEYKQIPDTWIMKENFADGKNPQDKGDSKRHGVPTKASVSTLRKVAKQGGRKGQLAHWMANMKAGRAK